MVGLKHGDAFQPPEQLNNYSIIEIKPD